MEVSPCSLLLLRRFERNAVIERFERFERASVLTHAVYAVSS